MIIARILAIVALFGAFSTAALSQGISQKVAVCDPAYVNRCIKPDTSGAVPVTMGGGALAGQVQGNSASAATDVGNPVKIGGLVSTVPPTSFTTGQRADWWMGAKGNGAVFLTDIGGANAAVVGTSATDAIAVSSSGGVYVRNLPTIFNGTTFDRLRSIQGVDGTGLGVDAVAVAPTSAATGAIAPTVSAAVTGSTIFKASAGNLYSVSVTAGASAGFLLVFNSTTVPADGAVTPQQCIPIAANAHVDYDATYASIPERFTTGIVGVFSTTGCYTKTISATAFLRAQFQ